MNFRKLFLTIGIVLCTAEAAALSLKTGREILEGLITALQLPADHQPLLDTYTAVRQRLPQSDQVESLSVAVLAGLGDLAGTACRARVELDRTGPVSALHQGIDFAQGLEQVSAELLDQLLVRYSQRMWQRDPSTGEKQMLRANWSEIAAAINANSPGVPASQKLQQGLVALCTSVASSPAGILF